MYKLLGAALLCCALTGCAGMNSDFDCNKTATDKCLTTAEANKLAAQGKSLNDIDNAVKVKKPAGEALPALHNTAPVVNPARPVSVAATGASSSAPLAARHASISPLSKPVTPLTRPASVITPLRSDTGAGRVMAQRIPDDVQRLWIAPWVDTDDNFHQPAVVEFVKSKSRWDEGFRVIGEGGE
ncbi:type IV conjugative transfer system lipoprotein TraV [Metakosakonia massiliensis]|uniref:Type IV conjugative transfer system lipoprotein (TraV) n=1 Tax=Phytobacter massiliensis TaxID=1485952 RepID=A0A6N3ECJ9_9ENTR